MKNPGNTFFYQIAWTGTQTWFRLMHRTEAYGAHNIPAKGSFILACNHASFLDPPAFGGNLPRELHFFARKTLFKGVLGRIITDLNSIPVDRDGDSDISAFKRVFSALKNDGGLLLFPEGTRTPNGQLQTAKKGVGLIACRAQVPVIPARIFGSYAVWGRHKKIPDFRPQIKIVIGCPLSVEDFDPGKHDPQRYQTAANTIMAAITRLYIPYQHAV